MASSNFWDGRENIKSKPSVERRTERVLNHVMEKYSIGIGQAMEKVMRENIWDEMISELSEMYPDITNAS